MRDALQLVESGTSSTRARPALRTSRSGMSRIVNSGSGWTRVTYWYPRISYPRVRGVGQCSRLELQSMARRCRCRGELGSVGMSGAGDSPRRLNTVTVRQILGMAQQQSVIGFERLVDGVVPVDTDVAVSDEVAVATIWSLRQVANRVSNWSQYRIGRLLQTLVTNDGSPRAEVLAHVCNTTQAELSLCQSGMCRRFVRTVHRYHMARRRGEKQHHALPVRGGAGPNYARLSIISRQHF